MSQGMLKVDELLGTLTKLTNDGQNQIMRDSACTAAAIGPALQTITFRPPAFATAGTLPWTIYSLMLGSRNRAAQIRGLIQSFF